MESRRQEMQALGKSQPDRVCSQCNRLTDSLLIGCVQKAPAYRILYSIFDLGTFKIQSFSSSSIFISLSHCVPFRSFGFLVYGTESELAFCSCFIYVFIGWLWLCHSKADQVYLLKCNKFLDSRERARYSATTRKIHTRFIYLFILLPSDCAMPLQSATSMPRIYCSLALTSHAQKQRAYTTHTHRGRTSQTEKTKRPL